MRCRHVVSLPALLSCARSGCPSSLLFSLITILFSSPRCRSRDNPLPQVALFLAATATATNTTPRSLTAKPPLQYENHPRETPDDLCLELQTIQTLQHTHNIRINTRFKPNPPLPAELLQTWRPNSIAGMGEARRSLLQAPPSPVFTLQTLTAVMYPLSMMMCPTCLSSASDPPGLQRPSNPTHMKLNQPHNRTGPRPISQ